MRARRRAKFHITTHPTVEPRLRRADGRDEQEARRGGPNAIAEYAALGAYHRLAREIFELRKAAGLTKRQLAARSGVRQADISRVEAGDANPTLATIAALAYALGAEVSLKPQPRRKAVGSPRRRALQRTGTVRRRPPGVGQDGIVALPPRHADQVNPTSTSATPW
jgi:transcriptional regulator with XRE-family HTH domain